MAKITDFEQDIIDMIEQKSYKALKEKISDINPYDLAMLLDNFRRNIHYCLGFYQRTGGNTFVEMDGDRQKPLSIASRIKSLGSHRRALY